MLSLPPFPPRGKSITFTPLPLLPPLGKFTTIPPPPSFVFPPPPPLEYLNGLFHIAPPPDHFARPSTSMSVFDSFVLPTANKKNYNLK